MVLQQRDDGVRGTAHRVPFSVASGRTVLPSRIRTASRRDWNSVQSEVEVSSRYLPWVGIHASQSNLRAAEEPRSPVATSITWNGSSRDESHCFSHCSSLRCSSWESSGAT